MICLQSQPPSQKERKSYRKKQRYPFGEPPPKPPGVASLRSHPRSHPRFDWLRCGATQGATRGARFLTATTQGAPPWVALWASLSASPFAIVCFSRRSSISAREVWKRMQHSHHISLRTASLYQGQPKSRVTSTVMNFSCVLEIHHPRHEAHPKKKKIPSPKPRIESIPGGFSAQPPM